jgi:hypothetical protein
MMFPLAVPAYINEPLSYARWPVLQLKVQPRKHGLPVIRCSLSIPGRRQQRHTGGAAAGRSGLAWSSGLCQGFQVAYQYQQVALEKSLQTLQRVGTLIRSTSMDYMSALGTKKHSNQGLPPPGQQPPEDEQQQAARQLKASLSRFITTASKGEVSNAAMLSDLSNLAYDVQAISTQRLQDTHNLVMVAHSKQAAAQLLAAGSAAAAARVQLQAAADAESATPFAVPASSQLLQGLPRPAAVRRSQEAAAVSAGTPQSPAAAGAAPGGFMAAYASSNSFGQSGSAPTSPRTPFVLSSFAETDDMLAPGEVQPATASGTVSSPGTPRRTSSALSAAAPSRSGSLAATPAGSGPLPLLQSSGSAGAVLAAQLMQYQLQDLDAVPAMQYQLPADVAEQQAMLDLQQQEQQVLLEMQHTQQLQLLLQQEQAIMQQLQEQASLSSSIGAEGADSADASAANSSSNTWWWLQQLQRQATAAAALATAAAAGAAVLPASSSSSSTEPKPDAPPSDWFICDGPGSDGSSAPVRYFVIQGSITLDHWRINLTIDPCEFEGGALGGVKVHRGVYEAALEMLDMFVPYVREHLAQHPDGKIAFTGHSLGGSLATLLMLLLVHR